MNSVVKEVNINRANRPTNNKYHTKKKKSMDDMEEYISQKSTDKKK